MSSGSHSIEGTIVPKFDMHTFTSTMTVDEVNNMVEHLEINPTVSLFRANYKLNKQGHWFSFERRSDEVVANMPEFLKFPRAGGVRIGRGTALRVNEVIEQHTTPPLLAGTPIPDKSSFQKTKAAGKRPRTGGHFRRIKKRKTTPLTSDLSNSEDGGSRRSGSKTINLVSPLTTIAPINENAKTGGGNQSLQSDGHIEEEVGSSAPYQEDQAVTSFPPETLVVTKMDPSGPTSLNDDYRDLYHTHSSCRDMSQRLTDTQNELVATLRTQAALSDDHNALQYRHLDCAGRKVVLSEKLGAVEKENDDLLDKTKSQEERIKELEEVLSAKVAALSETEKNVDQEKKDLERLTVYLSQAEIVKHKYVRQLLPTVIRRLLSSTEYKKSLSEPFNQAISVGWSKGVKVDRTEE
ncbi:hypothetical protein Tco_0979401 [Tanacetum coccineum]